MVTAYLSCETYLFPTHREASVAPNKLNNAQRRVFGRKWARMSENEGRDPMWTKHAKSLNSFFEMRYVGKMICI